MADQEAAGATYHVLLIGVDNYPGHALQGCVNDVDAVHRVLVGPRMRIPEDRIRCLVSPLPGANRTPIPGEQEASAANIRRELEALGSAKVAAGDRVFIYYCGHGYRAAVKADDGATFHREALVPADFERTTPRAFLFDFDVNRLLQAIARRTTSVTVMLDSCHSAGATRRLGDPAESVVRSLGDQELAPIPDPAGAQRAHGADPVDVRVALGVGDCQVVAACLAHQLAREGTYGGQRHGLFTHAFTAALDAAPDGDLRTIPWARIWEALRATMASQQADQVPTMTGHAGRAVFGGPPVDGDAGMPVSRDGDRYRLEAGALADVTEGAELAIYGELPRSFPPLGSDADRQARCGLVRVARATPASATATAVEPFVWPTAARARLVKAGDTARLRYAVTPGHPEIQIAASPLLERVDAPAAAAVRLELRGDRLLLTDDEHTVAPDAAVLCELQPDELELARRVLEHYHAYARPLRLARRATPGSDGALRLSVLACGEGGIDSAAAQSTRPPEAPRRNGRYELVSGAQVCFRVCNTGADRMRVTLFDVAASGRVQKLGDEIIEGNADHVFWDTSRLGAAFPMLPARGKPRGIDRLVAIGRIDTTVDLDHLVVDTRFSDIIDAIRRGDRPRHGTSDGGAAPLDRWAAAVAVVAIGPG